MAYIGPNTKALDFTHMTDIRVSGVKPQVFTNSIIDYLEGAKKFTIFLSILKRSNYYDYFKDLKNGGTIFVPSDEYMMSLKNYVQYMDILTARKIVQASTLSRKVCSDVITSMPIVYLVTMLPMSKLEVMNFIDNDGTMTTTLNNLATVKTFDIEVDNGIIHIVDKLVYPLTRSTARYSTNTA